MPKCAKKREKECQNIWMKARWDAGYRSKHEALRVVPFSERTLARIETGEKMPTPEEALTMAEAYNIPGLTLRYCSDECPIGKKYRCKVTGKDFASATLTWIKEDKDMDSLNDLLIKIGSDGRVNNNEEKDFEEIINELDDIIQAATEIKYWTLTEYIKQKPAQKERVTNKKAAEAAR